MKKYFEYEINESVKEKLLKYYEDVEESQKEYNVDLKSDLKLKRIREEAIFSINESVMDVGCFKGYILRKISKEIESGLGVDISENIINLNIEKNTYKNIKYSKFDGESIFVTKKFDKILLLDVLEHSFNPDALIKSIIDRLKPNGELILEVPYTGWVSELITKKYHAGHLRYYDPQYIKNYIQKKGLNTKKIKSYNSVPMGSFFLKYEKIHEILDFLINLIPPKIYPYFGEIILICEKSEVEMTVQDFGPQSS